MLRFALFALLASSFIESGLGFSVGNVRLSSRTEKLSQSALFGKGLNKARNKQAALREKLAKAREQNQKTDNSAVSKSPSEKRLTDREIKEINDRRRFEELLQKGAPVLSNYEQNGYLSKEQEEEEISAAQAGVDRIFEGDPAPTDCFEELVNIRTENAIGSAGKSRLVPWLAKKSQRHNDYVVVLCDPRGESIELRNAVHSVLTELPADIKSRLVVINGDSPAENRRWIKKTGLEGKIEVLSDEKQEWMRQYTALGQKRWSMTMFVLADARVQKLARELDTYSASQTIKNAVASMKETGRL